MAFTKSAKPIDSFSAVAKPAHGSKGQFGIGRFGSARFGKVDVVWDKVAKSADGFSKVAKP